MSLWTRAQAVAAAGTALDAGAMGPADDPLQRLLADPTVDEVVVNGPAEVWVERRGRLERADLSYPDAEALRDACVGLVARAGRRLDDSQPLVDARLADGSRLNVVLPPLAPDGPLVALRRFSPTPFSLADLVERGTMDEATADLLGACVLARLNVVISGGTSSGKTSLLAALASLAPAGERIVTVEDSAELRIERPHVVRLEARLPNLEQRGAITVRDLVRNALRMRPDRLVVGEVRGGEALDMLQAMNTGHDGSLTTVHANGPPDALRRIETMALMSGMEIPHEVVREQVASAVDVVVQLCRRRDGARRLTAVAAVEPDGRGWRIGGRAAVAARVDARLDGAGGA